MQSNLINKLTITDYNSQTTRTNEAVRKTSLACNKMCHLKRIDILSKMQIQNIFITEMGHS